jgi:hypothetical protein
MPDHGASPLDPNASLPIEAAHETSGGGLCPDVTGLSTNCTPAVKGWGAVGFALTADAITVTTQKFVMAGPI